MTNKCRYCSKKIKRTGGSWEVCECDKAQKEWVICMEIQVLEKQLNKLKKDLGELRKRNNGF